MLELSFRCLESGWGQAAGTCEDWRACGLDMMSCLTGASVEDTCMRVGNSGAGRGLIFFWAYF